MVSKFHYILTKKFLEEQIIKNKKSHKQIADEVGCSAGCVNQYCKKYNISKRIVEHIIYNETWRHI